MFLCFPCGLHFSALCSFFCLGPLGLLSPLRLLGWMEGRTEFDWTFSSLTCLRQLDLAMARQSSQAASALALIARLSLSSLLSPLCSFLFALSSLLSPLCSLLFALSSLLSPLSSYFTPRRAGPVAALSCARRPSPPAIWRSRQSCPRAARRVRASHGTRPDGYRRAGPAGHPGSSP